MNDTLKPVQQSTNPNRRKKKRDVESATPKRRNRYIVAALKRCRAICEGKTKQELHPAVQLRAAEVIVAIENGTAIDMSLSSRALRETIKNMIANDEVSQSLLQIAGLVKKIEQDQRRIVAPIVEQASKEIAEAEPPSPQIPAPPETTANGGDDLKNILRQLKSKADESKATFLTLSHEPKENTAAPSAANPMPPTTKLIPQVSQSYLSDDEIAAVHEFAEFRSSAVELESALSPYLQIEWGGMDRDRITSVSLTGAKIAPADRVSITPALIERGQRLATSPSPRDRQLVREWTEVVTKAPIFMAGVDVLKEIFWLKQQVGL